MIFGSLDGNRTVGMEFLHALKAFILHGSDLFRHMGLTVFIQLEIMRFSRPKENAYDIQCPFIGDDLNFHRMSFFYRSNIAVVSSPDVRFRIPWRPKGQLPTQDPATVPVWMEGGTDRF